MEIVEEHSQHPVGCKLSDKSKGLSTEDSGRAPEHGDDVRCAEEEDGAKRQVKFVWTGSRFLVRR